MAKDNETFDPWELGSGLPDDFDCQFNEVYFEFDPQYNDGQTLVLKIEFSSDDDDIDEGTMLFSCGDGWETKDKGKTASREDGKQKPFGKTSGIGLLVTSAVECGAGDVLKSRGTPMDAEIWKGLKFHMKRRPVNYGGEIGTKERLLPTEFQGEIGGKSSGKSSGSSGSGGSKSTPVKEAPGDEAEGEETGGGSGGGLAGALKVKLFKLAKECESHDQFVERAFTEVEEVNGNEEAEAAIMAEEGANSIWAKAKG